MFILCRYTKLYFRFMPSYFLPRSRLMPESTDFEHPADTLRGLRT